MTLVTIAVFPDGRLTKIVRGPDPNGTIASWGACRHDVTATHAYSARAKANEEHRAKCGAAKR